MLLSAPAHLKTHPDLQAVQEDIVYQSNHIKLLIRSGSVQEAMALISDLEEYAQPYQESLTAGIAYLVPFLRGRAYVQQDVPNQALPHLEAALEIARPDAEATARVRNLLGAVFFEQSQPRLALEQHLLCLESIHAHAINDLYFRVSVYRNIANEYCAIHEHGLAIDIYKEALAVLDDLNDPQQEAVVYWGLCRGYKITGDLPRARLYASRAIDIYVAKNNWGEAASVSRYLAETLSEDKRMDEAREVLDRAKGMLEGNSNKAILCFLEMDYTLLALRLGELGVAARHAEEGISLAQAYYKDTRDVDGHRGDGLWQDPIRICAEALQMAALVEEARERRVESDSLFEEALGLLEAAGYEETRHSIRMQYARVLEARGDYEKAVAYYQGAAELQPRPMQKVI
jgi:tetratricopeptide (TPR) repeat protein